MAALEDEQFDSEIRSLTSDGQSVEVTIDGKHIQWKFDQKDKGTKLKSTDRCLEWKNIFGVRSTEGAVTNDKHQQLELFYIIKSEDNKLSHKKICFVGELSGWIDKIKERSLTGKPRRLLTIINPASGFGKGQQTYEKKVAPLFALADISAEVIVSEKSGHATEVLDKYDLTSIDGIVVVGGDGMYHEVVNSLLVRIQRENGVDLNDMECQHKSPSIPIGIIPTGTGNGMAGWSCGCIDVETSVFHVIRGVHHKCGALSINVDGKHVVYGGLLFGYGILSDIIKISEARRWMKVFRYPVTMLGCFLGRQRCSKAKLTYKTLKESENIVQGKMNYEETDWQMMELEEFLSIMTFTAFYNTEGDKIKCSLNSQTMHLLSYDRINKSDQMKFFFRLGTMKPTTFDFEWLKQNRNVTRFHILVDQSTVNRGSNYTEKDRDMELFMNVDGESIPISKPDIHVRFCGELVPLYSTHFD